MTREVSPEAWNQVAESVALQHNTEIKCALQLVVESGEAIEVSEIRQRLLSKTGHDPSARLPDSNHLRRSFIRCFIPNGTFEPVGEGYEVVKKLPNPTNDALAGHNLRLSRQLRPRLELVLGQTQMNTGLRRAPLFSLGILRYLDGSEEPLSTSELSQRLDTSRETIREHVQHLGALGVLTCAKQLEGGKYTIGSIISPQFVRTISWFVQALEGVANQDETALSEGMDSGQFVMSRPHTLTALLAKRKSKRYLVRTESGH